MSKLLADVQFWMAYFRVRMDMQEKLSACNLLKLAETLDEQFLEALRAPAEQEKPAVEEEKPAAEEEKPVVEQEKPAVEQGSALPLDEAPAEQQVVPVEQPAEQQAA
jgi:hypothetical protein